MIVTETGAAIKTLRDVIHGTALLSKCSGGGPITVAPKNVFLKQHLGTLRDIDA